MNATSKSKRPIERADYRNIGTNRQSDFARLEPFLVLDQENSSCTSLSVIIIISEILLVEIAEMVETSSFSTM